MLIGYARVSTPDQALTLQVDALIAAGVDRRHLHTDKASGVDGDRPGLMACLDSLVAGDVLVVWKLDRLGRSLSDLVKHLDNLASKSVGFRSITEGFDTSTPAGKALYGMTAVFAEFERSLMSERVQAGMDAARAAGVAFGRPRAISDEKLSQIRVALASSGLPRANVARIFGVKLSTLNDALKRPAPPPKATRTPKGETIDITEAIEALEKKDS